MARQAKHKDYASDKKIRMGNFSPIRFFCCMALIEERGLSYIGIFIVISLPEV